LSGSVTAFDKPLVAPPQAANIKDREAVKAEMRRVLIIFSFPFLFGMIFIIYLKK